MIEDLWENEVNFNLIFMDLQMPIMNGYETSTLLKKMMKEKKLP